MILENVIYAVALKFSIMKLAFILLLTAFAPVISSCPRYCYCQSTSITCKSSTATRLPINMPISTTTLKLEYPKVQSIPINYFWRLRNISYLVIRNFNSLFITSDTFDGLSNSLKLLDLSNTNIKSIEPKSFKNFSRITELDLSYNKIDVIEKDMFFGLSNLKKLFIEGINIAEIHADSFRNLQSLEYISLQYNKLQRIGNNIFDGLVNLKEIHLNDNKITAIEDRSFFTLMNLVELQLYRNKLTTIGNTTFVGLTQLADLQLGDNEIHTISPNSFQHCPLLYTLNLEGNYLSRITNQTFYGMPKVHSLYLQRNRIHKIDKNAFQFLPNLANLNLDDNAMLQIDRDMFYGLVSLETLRLTNNIIEKFKLAIGLGKLWELSLSNNRLKSIDHDCFIHTPKLEVLKIDRNKLSTIDTLLANKLETLRSLSLNDNFIKELSIKAFMTFSKLEYLDLHNNNITTLNIQGISESHPHLKRIYLTKNPLSCNCHLVKDIDHINKVLPIRYIYGICNQPIQLTNIPLSSLVASKRCKNNATGIVCATFNETNYSCECRIYYEGKFCQHKSTTCNLEQCNNNGHCLYKDNSVQCMCNSRYTGRRCDKRISLCRHNGCQNNAICHELSVTAYKCKCRRNFKGIYCQESIPYCNSNPCKNNGTCLDTNSSFNCTCHHGYTGRRCKTIIKGKTGKNILTIVLIALAITLVILLSFAGVYCARRKLVKVCDFHLLYVVSIITVYFKREYKVFSGF